MNTAMIKHLVWKDWYFSRTILGIYMGGCVLAILLILFGGEFGAMIGGIGFIAAIMSFGIHIVFASIVNERKLQTLPFVMSLPVSFKEYTAAKMIATSSAFVIPWAVISALVLAISYSWAAVPNGDIPFITLMLVELLVAYVIFMCVAIATESEGWTIVAIAVCNTCFSLFIFTLKKIEGIAAHMDGPVVVWSKESLLVLGAEFGVIAALIAITFFVQSRKTDFL
jgi:ABC-2 type transport system permease protein